MLAVKVRPPERGRRRVREMEREKLRKWLENPVTFVKWLVFAGITGLVCGGVATAFYHTFSAVTDLRHANPWLLWLLPVGGLAIVLLYRICGMEGDRGRKRERGREGV